MPSEERDRQFERLLQRHLRSHAVDAACPDAEILATYHERTLSPEELAKCKEHISGCVRCQETLALLEETNAVALHDWEEREVALEALQMAAQAPRAPQRLPQEENAAPAASLGTKITSLHQPRKALRPRAWRWVMPAGALAAALIVFVAVKENRARLAESSVTVQVAENREAAVPKPPAVRAFEEFPKSQNAGNNQNSLNKAESSSAELLRKLQSASRAEQLSTGTGAETTPAPVRTRNNSSATTDQRAATNRADSEEANSGRSGLDAGQKQIVPLQENKNVTAIPGVANAPFSPPAAPARSAGTGGAAGGVVGIAKKNANSADHTQGVQAESETVEVQGAAPGVSAQLAINYQGLRNVAATNPRVILAPDGKRAWRVGTAGSIESSSDGGLNWKVQKSGVEVDLTGGSAPSDKVCWVVGKAGTILLTKDRGEHWNLITSPIIEDLVGVHAVDAKHASIWNVANKRSFETTDGGMTWVPAAND
jgi:hypothetical protein